MRMSILIGTGIVVRCCAAPISLGEEIPRELTTPNYRMREITTIGITWGVAQNGNPVHIVRFEVDLTAPPKPERDASEGASP